MGLTNGCDFQGLITDARLGDKSKRKFPYILVGSPPCTWSSVLQELNLHVNRNNPAWKVK